MKTNQERVDSIFIKAEKYYKEREKKRRTAYKIMTMAACIVILMTGIIAIPKVTNNINNPNNNNPSQNNNSIADQDITGEEGVLIPAIQLPKVKKGESVAMDMIGLIVYQGKIYTQDGFIEGDSERVEPLIGEYLGYAVGNIDEWSSKKEYDKEFASNIRGDVYSINGYDTTFRIGILLEIEGKNVLHFFSNLNGIKLVQGRELYEDRLHLSENYQSASYQKHSDWDYAQNNFKEFTAVSEDDIKAFIDALDHGIFTDLYKKDEESIYDKDFKRAHIYFHMKDNTIIPLDLFEGGYVRYENMSGQIFVQITDEVFDKIFDAALQ